MSEHDAEKDATREWPNGDTVTRREAEDAGWSWSEVCLYTEPVSRPIPPASTDGASR